MDLYAATANYSDYKHPMFRLIGIFDDPAKAQSALNEFITESGDKFTVEDTLAANGKISYIYDDSEGGNFLAGYVRKMRLNENYG